MYIFSYRQQIHITQNPLIQLKKKTCECKGRKKLNWFIEELSGARGVKKKNRETKNMFVHDKFKKSDNSTLETIFI